jgi:hypothetical protein
VGLAVISITIWIILFIRRRRQEIGLEQAQPYPLCCMTRVSNRISIEPESSASSHHSRYGSAEFLAIPMPNPNPERHRRSTSGLLENNKEGCPLCQMHITMIGANTTLRIRNSRDGYRDMPSPTTPHLNIPPPSAFAPYRDRSSNDGMGMVEVGLDCRWLQRSFTHAIHIRTAEAALSFAIASGGTVH